MYYLNEITVSNVENVLGQLSADWRGNEEWIREFVLRLNDLNKKLRDDLRENFHSMTHQYKIRLAFHYYDISSLFNKLYVEHRLDIRSIIEWLRKCTELLREISPNQETAQTAKLTADAEKYLGKYYKIQKKLEDRRAKLKNDQREYVSLCAALGDLSGNVQLEASDWLRKCQNLIIARIIAFLEDSFTRREFKDSVVTSNLLASLGLAYKTAGIPFLAERYQNTARELLKSILESTTESKKQNLKNTISECIQNGDSLEYVYRSVEEIYAQPLSILDRAYISRNYNTICFKLFIDETVDFVKHLLRAADRQTICAIIADLRSCDTLLRIPLQLNQSVLYKLLTNNYRLIAKDEEQKWINILKKESFTVLIDFVIITNNELKFLEALLNLLGSVKDTKYLESKLNIYQVITQDKLTEIITGVLSLDVREFGEELTTLQAAAAPLKDVKSLFYGDKFREFLIDYFKPPKIRMVKLDGRNVLEIVGVKIVMSEVAGDGLFEEILNDTTCEEIRIVGDSVHVDESFGGSKWSGKNVVVVTKKIRVYGNVEWSVSGKDSPRVYDCTAGRHNGTGRQGEDGDAGESGGNVLVLAKTITNPRGWTIRSHGGNGSNGQDGGDGSDGQDGKGITKPDFDKKFPPTAKFQVKPRLENVKTTLESIQNLGTITYKWYERPVTNIPAWVPFGTAYKHTLAADSYCLEKNVVNIIADLNYNIKNIMDERNKFNGNIFIQAVTPEGNDMEFSFQRTRETVTCQSYFLFKGAPGKPGTKGGPPGLGGQGGFSGDVIVRNPNDLKSFGVIVESHPGADGKNGKGGKYGSHGKTGCDMGYLDYEVSEFFNQKWPKWRGDAENSKIELRYYDYYQCVGVWSPFRRYKNYNCKYVGMTELGIDNHKSRQFDERMNLRQNQERGFNAKATKKKTISQASVLSEYQLLGSSETALQNLFNQIDETNQELLQSMARTETKSQVNTKAEITRCIAYKKKTKPLDSKPKLSTKIDHKSKLLEQLKVKPMPVIAWAALTSIYLTKEEIKALASEFDSLFASESTEIQAVREMFLEKYRFATLNSISKILPCHTIAPGVVDAVTAARYLKIEDSTCISHADLGTLDQFLYNNKDQDREKLAHYVEHTLKYFEAEFPEVFRSFVLALDSSTSDLKSCLDDYRYFLEKEERGLKVFPESLARIDLKHSKNKNIGRHIKQYIINNGCTTHPCIQLLAVIFNANIRVYKESDQQYESFYLQHNFNPIGPPFVHVLSQSGKCTPMQVDWEHVQLDKKREILGNQCTNILRDVNELNTRESLDKYLDDEAFFDKSYHDVEDSTTRSSERVVLEGILKKFENFDDRELLRTMLSKIAYYVSGDVVKSILRKFSLDGRSVSVQELCCLMNAVLTSAADGPSHSTLYQWIVLAYPQDQWLDQVLLMDLESHFKNLPTNLKEKWERYLSKIENKNILIQLREKLGTSEIGSNEKCIEEILFLLSEIAEEFLPGELGLAEWPCALKEQYWSHKLTKIRDWNDAMELSTHSYYLLSIENNLGDQLVKDLLDLLILHKNQLSLKLLTTILTNFYNETWDLSLEELEKLENTKIVIWVDWMKARFRVDGAERDLRRLCELVDSNANTSDAVKTLLPNIKSHLDSIGTNLQVSLCQAENDHKPIRNYNESDINQWVKSFEKALKDAKNVINVRSNVDIWVEMLDVVDTGIFLKRGFRLRDTQKLAVMILLKNKNSERRDGNKRGNGTLAQVATGEGKSLIVVALSILEALIGGKVDIITSSSVLAKRDAENNRDIYNMFGIDVSHNCTEDIEARKQSYSGNQVVYGDLSDFQRDCLLHEFYNVNVLGDRKFETVVVDEVDSMLLDKGNNMLYLSHNIPGLDKLESVFLFIWQWISRPCGDRDSVFQSMDAKNIRDAVVYELYGTIKVEDIKALDVDMTESHARDIWEKMKKANILNELSRLKIDKLERRAIEEMLSPDLTQYADRLCYLIHECIFRDRQIFVPNYLKPFVDIHLDKWIDNAITAFFMKNGESYVVDVDRTGTSPDRHPNITIIDKDTGTDQSNSQWDEALHQFLQLKHGCKLSVLSLKAVFISNVSYFKQYNHLCGLTGTLGSQAERTLLREVHSVDFVTIPTAKPKQFEEYVPKICNSVAGWRSSIETAALEMTEDKGRSVLVICGSVNDVENLRQSFEGKDNVHTYTRDHEEFDIARSKRKLGPGHVILATNLAGRGTDIKINEALKNAGGLHVIVTYLANNKRIEQQAFGRAARCGEKGSGQLIIPMDGKQSKIMNLKNERDNKELERISEIKSFYENHIKVEEMCFRKFKEQFIALKNQISKANVLNEAAVNLLTNPDKIDAIKTAGQTLVNARGLSKNVEDILLKTCINKWAFWLDQNGKLVKDWRNPASQNALKSSLNKFINDIENPRDWAARLDGNPLAMVELAKDYQQNKNHDAAIELLDKVIALEPDFSAVAHYYKAAALGGSIDWESNPNDDKVETLYAELAQAEKLFQELAGKAMTNSALIGKLKHENEQSLVQVDAYEEQQKNKVSLYNYFSGSISDILGHGVTPESFCSWNIKDQTANNLYKILIQGELLTKPKITSNVSQSDLETISCDYDISQSVLTDFLNEHDGQISFKQFKNDLKRKFRLPSKEGFWKELLEMKLLENEVKYVIVKRKTLGEVDPSLLDALTGERYTYMNNHELKLEKNQILLNSEQIKEQTSDTFIFEKGEFINCVGRVRYDALKEKNVLAFNSRCEFQLESLKSAAKSLPKTLTVEDENVNESFFEDLLNQNVIQGSPERFHVVANSEEIERLSFADRIKDLLKEYSGVSRFQLVNYDSISVADLTRNRVTQNDAQTILQELERMKIIEKISTDSYRLTTHYTNIDQIRLKFPVYEDVTKAVMKISFSYRIALQKMVSHIESEAKLPLKSKPHTDLFWSLYDYKAIRPSQVQIDVSKEAVEENLSTRLRRNLGNILQNSGCISHNRVEGLIEDMVDNNWLISSELKVQKDKTKRKELDGCYSDCQKTVAVLLDELATLSDESTIVLIYQSLDRMKSTLKALDVPSFGLTPLSEALSEGDFSMIQELSCFILGGLGELIVLQEKAYTFKFWVNVTCVVLLGVCQILIGALIDMYSVGALTYVGNAFMSEGISDIMYAVGAMRTGYFSWKDYGRHKIESVALTLLTAGVGAYWSKGTKYSRVAQKLNPTGLKVAGKAATQQTGAMVLNRISASVAKQVLKTTVLKTGEALLFGAANTLIDTTINNSLQSFGKAIASQVLADIDQEVQNHKITATLERAFRLKGESNARLMVQDLTQLHFAKTAEWDRMSSWAVKIFSSAVTGIAQAGAKKKGANVKTSTADMIAQLTMKALALGNYAKHIIEVRSMTERMLDELSREIDSKLDSEQTEDIEEFDEIKFERFKIDIVDRWREEITKKSGEIIGQHIISPLMKDGAHMLLRYAGRKIKDFYRQFKDKRCYQQLISCKMQYQDDILEMGDDEAREGVKTEYHATLLKLAAKTWDPNVFADIIEEGIEMDATCLQAFVAVLPRLMNSRGNKDGINIELEKDDVNQTFKVEGTSGVTHNIRLKITNGHYGLLNDEGQIVPQSSQAGGSNDCLIQAIAQRIDMGVTIQEVRSQLAKEIRNNLNIQNIIRNGYHRYGFALGVHGGRSHPYEKIGHWIYDPKVDIDLLKYRNENGEKIYVNETLTDEELNIHMQKGFNETLKKVNQILMGKSQIEGWENVKLKSISRLRPEDFEPTQYDTFYTSGSFGAPRPAYYPVEMEAIVEVKNDRNTFKLVVEINIDELTSPDQKGPQGAHIGYNIKQFRPQGEYNLPRGECPKKVTGHCTINTNGNYEVPRRAFMEDGVDGIVYVPGRKYKDVPKKQQPVKNIPCLPPYRLFHGWNRLGQRLQRTGNGTGTTRNRSFPSSSF